MCFRAYIGGISNLIVEVNASSIEGVLKCPDVQPSATINRWISCIKDYNFTLHHVPATQHKAPDALSRRQFVSENEESLDSDSDELQNNAALASKIYHRPFPVPTPSPFPHLDDTSFTNSETRTVYAAMASYTYTDQDLNDILQYLVTDQMPQLKTMREQRQFKKKAAPFFLEQAHMYRHHPGHPPQVVIFPKDYRKEIFCEMHE